MTHKVWGCILSSLLTNIDGNNIMARTVTKHTRKQADIGKRIDDFIAKLESVPQKGSRVTTIVRNEKRWLGIESNDLRYSLRTTKAYITRYRAAISERLPFHDTFESRWEKLVAKYPELESIDTRNSSPKDVMREVVKAKAEIKDKTTGLYDDLNNLQICHRAYALMKLRDGQNATIKTDDKAKVVKGKTKKLKVSKKVATAAANQNLNSDKMYRQATALMLCCGRRPAELFKSASFEKIDESTVLFKGQAKGKARGARDNYEIPILFVSVDEFLKAFESFREKTISRGFHQLTNKLVNARISADISDTARKMLLNDNAVLYTCRSVYANSVAELHPDTDRDILMAGILGHEHDDVNTVNSYQAVYLTDDSIESCAESYSAAKPKKRKRVAALGLEKTEESEQKKPATRNKRAVAFEKMQAEADQFGRAVSSLHAWAVEYLKSNPDAVFTQTMITKTRSTSRPAIKKWLELVAGK